MKQLKLRVTLILLSAILLLTLSACGSLGKLSGEELSKAEILKTLENYFAEGHTGRSEYIVIKNYTDLRVIYEYASEHENNKSNDFLRYLILHGNANEANENNTYPEEYFENGYIIVALTTISSGSYTYECVAAKNDGEIIINFDGTHYITCNGNSIGYVCLVPVDGAYFDEAVRIVRNDIQIDPPLPPGDSVTEMSAP